MHLFKTATIQPGFGQGVAGGSTIQIRMTWGPDKVIEPYRGLDID